MPSPVQKTLEDLEAMKAVRLVKSHYSFLQYICRYILYLFSVNLQRIEKLRDEFLQESAKHDQEESFLTEASVEKDQLYREKVVLIEEMKQVNNDINAVSYVDTTYIFNNIT